MLSVNGEPLADLSGSNSSVPAPEVGDTFPVEWVTISDPDPNVPQAALRKAIYNQGRALGAATFGRLEGCWYDKDTHSIVFSCTDGGRARQGQVWQYEPRGHRRGKLRLLFESPAGRLLARPDNLTASPGSGTLLCEDHSFNRPGDPFAPLPWERQSGSGRNQVHYLKGLSERGEIFDFAANALDNKEWAGACFSPDGRFLFANTQGATSSFSPNNTNPRNRRNFGRTYAIWGPWGHGAFGPDKKRGSRDSKGSRDSRGSHKHRGPRGSR